MNDGVKVDRLLKMAKTVEQYIELWCTHPDLLVDWMAGENFGLFFYQRIFLRCCFRFKYFFATFTRAFSKSFLSILSLVLRCILLPRSKLFLVAESKEQAASIFQEKFTELLDLFPMLKNELSNKVGERPTLGKDYARIVFKNKSVLDVVGKLMCPLI